MAEGLIEAEYRQDLLLLLVVALHLPMLFRRTRDCSIFTARMQAGKGLEPTLLCLTGVDRYKSLTIIHMYKHD